MSKNTQECLTMISKREKAYEGRGAKPRELCIAFEYFDIMGKHERKFLIWLLISIDYTSAQSEPTYINAQRNDNFKQMQDVLWVFYTHLRIHFLPFPKHITMIFAKLDSFIVPRCITIQKTPSTK